jgi:hypothetical protein
MVSVVRRTRWWTVLGLAAASAAIGGCWQIPSAHTISRNYSRGDAPVDPPKSGEGGNYDDFVSGGQVFKMYCGTCHNARALGERPFSNYEVAATHMRKQAYLTGKEYRQLIFFLRRWHDVGPPTPDIEPSPKRFIYSQPISELRKEAANTDTSIPAPQPRPVKGEAGETSAPAAKP